MENILRGLLSGNIIPWERKGSHSERQHEIARKIEVEERYFMEKMSLEDCGRFQALSKLYTELFVAEDENNSAYAFTLGSLLMLDITKEAENILGDLTPIKR